MPPRLSARRAILDVWIVQLVVHGVDDKPDPTQNPRDQKMTVYSATSFTSASRSAYNTVTLTITPTGTFGDAPTTSDTITVAINLADLNGTSTAVTSLVKALFCS